MGVFTWTGDLPAEGTVEGHETLSSSCFALEVRDRGEPAVTHADEGDPWAELPPPEELTLRPVHRVTICAPREHFAFAIGERVSATVSERSLELVSETDRVRLSRLEPRADFYAPGYEPLCEGQRLPCGAYRERLAWMDGGDRLEPGVAAVTFEGGVRKTRLLGAARRVAVASEACGLEVGVRATLLTSWEHQDLRGAGP